MATIGITDAELREIVRRSQSERYDYPDIFNDDCGLDLTGYNGLFHAVPSWGHRKTNTLRRITLEITTYRGISANAIHFYGKLEVQGVSMAYNKETYDYDRKAESEWERKNPNSQYFYRMPCRCSF